MYLNVMCHGDGCSNTSVAVVVKVTLDKYGNSIVNIFET